MAIRVLPANVANMIAAGEVVSRPSSVVKELMENAVDAGASSVSVIIRDAGRTLIQVIDDGCGMTPDEAVLCFERHATSKIASADDLYGINTFGFRGEALASIAAVSAVTLRTRREDSDTGVEVKISGGIQQSVDEVASPRGSNFAIRDLFYNIPARRKFLKSDNIEFKHIVAEFNKVALSRPELGFTLTHNDRDIIVLKPASSLKFRIQDLLGGDAAGEVIEVSAETSVVTVSGFVGRADSARKSLGNQYFFVNGRFFRSPYFNKAVLKAYEGLIPEGVTPSYFLYLEIPPHMVDVNISPTKTEVKFEEDSVIFQTLYACIRESIGKLSFGDTLDFDREDAPAIPVFSRSFEEYHPVAEPGLGTDREYNPFDNDGFPSEKDFFSREEYGDFREVPADGVHASAGTSRYLSGGEDYGKLFEDRSLPSASALMLGGKYVLTAVKSGIMLINVRRARERILFDRFLDALSRNSHVVQTAMFPEPVRVGVENVLLIEEHRSLLQSLGFDIRPLGDDTIVLNGVPEGYSCSQGGAPALVDFVIDAIRESAGTLEKTMTATLAEKFARIGAAAGETLTSPAQAQRLIDSLFACSNAEFTSSGRRVMTIVPIEEIDKKFQ